MRARTDMRMVFSLVYIKTESYGYKVTAPEERVRAAGRREKVRPR